MLRETEGIFLPKLYMIIKKMLHLGFAKQLHFDYSGIFNQGPLFSPSLLFYF